MFTITRQLPTSSFLPSSVASSSSTSKLPNQYGSANLDAMDFDMDAELDFNAYQYGGDDDMDGGPDSLGIVSPGEIITSSKEYMR
jgi:hypothetical protein